MILQLVLLSLITLFGFNSEPQPVRLQKKVEVSYGDKIKERLTDWANAHAFLILFVLFAVLTGLIICLVFSLTGLSATESGLQYNHFKDVI